MPLIQPKGKREARVWVIAETPLSTDVARGFMFSGGLGYMFEKMLADAGMPEVYICARRPDTDKPEYEQSFDMLMGTYKPPFIITLGAAGQHFCKELVPSTRDKGNYKPALSKYVGSLLKARAQFFDHYVMPLYDPMTFVRDWAERQITTYFDLQKLREEYVYWKLNNRLQALTFRQLVYQDMGIDVLLSYLNRFRKSNLISIDIETCYPKADSEFYPHPGYPLTIGIADSPEFGISFNLFREDKHETLVLWRTLASLLASVPQLGQNYFNFDAHYLSMLGFTIPLRKCKDTLIRHHILWPELPHKLQFQTRQYTREVYYKDEGHRWSLKNMEGLRRYNCLDVCVTYEIYLQQEEEFAMRKEIA